MARWYFHLCWRWWHLEWKSLDKARLVGLTAAAAVVVVGVVVVLLLLLLLLLLYVVRGIGRLRL